MFITVDNFKNNFMPRPCRCRRIGQQPRCTYFKPAGQRLKNLKEIQLTFEELEAIRLHDVQDLTEEQAAKKMQVSRSTFHRVLVSAQKKIAQALIEGSAIKIDGGNYKFKK